MPSYKRKEDSFILLLSPKSKAVVICQIFFRFSDNEKEWKEKEMERKKECRKIFNLVAFRLLHPATFNFLAEGENDQGRTKSVSVFCTARSPLMRKAKKQRQQRKPPK